MWKIRKLIKSLTSARGDGTSMISLICPPREQIAKVNSMLTTEAGTASNIKSRVNRQSVMSAISSTQQRLKLYNRIPDNGLVIFVGTVLTDDGKEKKLTVDFEPFRPINTSLYLCDNRFHTEALNELLQDDDVFGFIIMDGNGTLYGKLHGNTREVLHKFSVELPKKHGRGGQSSVRFARLRTEKRHNYVRKAAEMATNMFITNDMPNVKGLILAGSAEFKVVLSQSDLFDPRLKKVVLGIVDISYGGENGFNQAIELSQEILANTKYMAEKKLVAKFFEQITLDTGKFCHGIEDTMKALEMGAVEMLLVWEELPTIRYELKVASGDNMGKISVLYANPDEEKDAKKFKDPETGAELDVVEKLELVEWFAQNYQKFGTTLEFVTDKSQEGSQFCKGFGGIGGILRWSVEFQELEEPPLDIDGADWDELDEGF